jgi:hypothetical protein
MAETVNNAPDVVPANAPKGAFIETLTRNNRQIEVKLAKATARYEYLFGEVI